MVIDAAESQFQKFPGTRYMGSKNRIIFKIWDVLRGYHFESFLDVFAGSNVVSYFMKSHGKRVITNDFMTFSYLMSKAIIENNDITVSDDELMFLLENENQNSYVSTTFDGLYFSDTDNKSIDRIRANASLLDSEIKQAIAVSALVRACIKRRPRGVFTYTGQRYDDGRKDIRRSIVDHFKESLLLINNAVFYSSANCIALNSQASEINCSADMVYIDPPYFSKHSDNDYVRRYHFVEGLALNWEGLSIQNNTKTKKFRSYNSPYSNRSCASLALDSLVRRYKESIIAISYSSNSYPDKAELLEIISRHKNKASVHEFDHTYSFGNQNHMIGNFNNKVKEYLFIGED